jgi:hypothetical protein
VYEKSPEMGLFSLPHYISDPAFYTHQRAARNSAVPALLFFAAQLPPAQGRMVAAMGTVALTVPIATVTTPNASGSEFV